MKSFIELLCNTKPNSLSKLIELRNNCQVIRSSFILHDISTMILVIIFLLFGIVFQMKDTISFNRSYYLKFFWCKSRPFSAWSIACSITIGLGCRIKANCPLVGPGPVSEVPFMEVFLRDRRIYASFEENHLKLRTARLIRATGA